MEYLYSPKENAFYPAALEDAYRAAGTLPDDLVPVETDVFNEFSACPPQGKIRAVGDDGLPCWVDIPQKVVTEDEVKALARGLRDKFLEATDKLLVQDYTIDDVPLTEEQKSELAEVRLNFKRWPSVEDWPNIELPAIPRWILIEAVNNGYIVPDWPKESE
ncbi:tail fiber assembly protein [Enterobacter hormaechei]|uniref:tail fiber assembly protein n=1 Tax=Enterobacter hormaechei TaxID=158836 RepID=UPI002875719F|nr:tail fiber assembly protein [Enterobacter hormaechei]MCE1279765.1 tail fiber assembly protein [Enterobacter hormaechei]MCE1315719.1 tail fiber assembly protein [Enterobacter hormaechei]MDR9910452.1 tail fiber assembly protein [Enterobacter hormaechei subsp. steigerwaltii]